VLRESILPFFLGFSLVTFLFILDFLFDFLDLLLVKDVPPLIVLELFLLALGWITALSFPCGVLVAALMTYGRLAQDNEVTAMRALGVNVPPRPRSNPASSSTPSTITAS
jgi:lipopolysaccharide export system permease protein